MAKKSASQIAAENEYYRKHNIQIPQKEDKKKVVREPSHLSDVIHDTRVFDSKEFGEYIATINSPIVKMEDKELVKLLVERYDHVLNNIVNWINDPVRIFNFIKLMHCERGVCYLSRKDFGVIINDRKWIKDNMYSNKLYWWPQPKLLTTSKEMIDAISFRVTRLTEILNDMI